MLLRHPDDLFPQCIIASTPRVGRGRRNVEGRTSRHAHPCGRAIGVLAERRRQQRMVGPVPRCSLVADLSIAWGEATPEERKLITRQLFADVVVENRTVVAPPPRPELAPFFESLAVNPDPGITPKRKRRASSRANTQNPLIPPHAAWIVQTIPGRRSVGASKRDALLEPRPRKPDAARDARMRTLASQGRTLREIAADFGVSHETMRTVCRRRF
jgi:hypothetical protein